MAGCVEPTSEAGQKTAAKPTDEIDAVWASREEAVYNGKTFFYARNPRHPVVYIQAADRDASYSSNDMMAIGRQKTGCKAKFSEGALAVIPGFGPDADLKIVREKSKPLRWSLPLQC